VESTPARFVTITNGDVFSNIQIESKVA
jgi:hypothetical protein